MLKDLAGNITKKEWKEMAQWVAIVASSGLLGLIVNEQREDMKQLDLSQKNVVQQNTPSQ